MNRLLQAMLAQRDESQVANLSRFFKTGKGQYGEGDLFLGIKVPVTRAVVKQEWQNVTLDDLEECITSAYHEVRLAALLTLVKIFHKAKHSLETRQRCVDFYLSHTAYINNWDLVDLSCYEILGTWLLRETYKQDSARLREFLGTRYQTMPRTMLRYAIEKFPEEERKAYLKGTV